MAVKIRRTYKGAAVAAVLDSSGVSSSSQTAITLSTVPSTWPAGKFFVVVAPGTAQEEKMCVTISNALMTVVDPAVTSTSASANGRGVDNTTARSTIAGGATVYPVYTAVDADEANELTSTYSAQGHLVYQGASTFAGLGIGTAGQVLKVNSGATAPEWGQVATAGLADSSVTSAKIVDGTIVLADLAAALQAFLVPVGTITAYAGSSAPTGWLMCDGTAVSSGTYPTLHGLVGGNTPDLRNRFPLGKTAAGTGSTLLGTGGSTTIAEGNLPAHNHANTASATTSVTLSDPGHGHSTNQSNAGNHNHTWSATDQGAHQHRLDVDQLDSTVAHGHGSDGTLMSGSSATPDGDTNAFTETFVTGYEGKHDHSGTTSTTSDHGHSVSVNSNTTGIVVSSATTTVTMTNAYTGSGTAYFQPFLAVNYIIKHD